MKLLFSGYYGHKNAGDDAFIEVITWGAKKYWNNINSKFVSKSAFINNLCVKNCI